MPRLPQATELPLIGPLDRAAGRLALQLAQALRRAIGNGDLQPGELLPSTRQLAASLKVARGTVLEAFEQLIAEGFLEAQARGGTRVAAALAEAPPAPQQTPPQKKATTPAALGQRAAVFASVAQQFTPLPPVPFAVSVPVGAAAPGDAWRRLGNRLRARGAAAPSGYDDPQGVQVLREAIADYVRKSRSVRCHASQVIITSGTQQGLYLASQVLLDDDDRAWIEDPAYRGISGILESTRRAGQIVRVPVDEAGIDVDAGIALAADARAAFVTPSHQYPLGMPMSMARRNALLAWAQERGAWIVEDDYDSELRYAGHPFPSLQGLAPEQVVYLGTFSKILFPSLRLGYAIVPPLLTAAFCGARALMDRHAPSADQHVLAAFIGEGHLDRHIRRIRSVYAERRTQLLAMLARWIPAQLAWLQPSDQGMHVVLWLAEGIDDSRVVALAAAQGVALRAVSPMFAGRARHGLVLGLGGFSDAQMEQAVRRLADVIAALAATRTAPPTRRNQHKMP